jgi:hypothetical protein
MRRIVLPVTAIAVLPLVLAACGSASTASSKTTSTAHLSPQAAVDAAYHTAGANPISFHINEAVYITVNGKNYGDSVISGNVHSDPTRPSASYASLTESLSTLGKSEGNILMLLKNATLYINAGGVHTSGANITPGWKSLPLSGYLSKINSGSQSPVSPSIITSPQSSLLGAALSGAKITSHGSSTVGGQAVNVYTATIPYQKLANGLSNSKGELASSLSKILSLYHMTGTDEITVDIAKNTNRIADVSSTFSSTFAPVDGSPVKYHFDLGIRQQYSNYGVKFAVRAPASAKSITSLKQL